MLVISESSSIRGLLDKRWVQCPPRSRADDAITAAYLMSRENWEKIEIFFHKYLLLCLPVSLRLTK